MIIDLNEQRIRTLAQVRAVLDGTQALSFAHALDRNSRDAGITSLLARSIVLSCAASFM